MGWLGKIDEWLIKRKDEAHERKINHKRRKDISVVDHVCNFCGHPKGFYKNGVFKCTKCGKRDVL